MHVARRVRRNGGDLLRQCRDERNGERAGLARLGGERLGVEGGLGAHLRDGLRVRGRHDAAIGARLCERRFEARHRGKQAFVGERRRAALVGKDELEAQKSKNTVSSRPCSTTFHSSVPSPALRAMSVERRSAGTSARIGSAAFAGSSGKYMRVMSCFSSPRMKMVTLRCGACTLFARPGTRPGLMVLKRKAPCSSVSERP